MIKKAWIKQLIQKKQKCENFCLIYNYKHEAIPDGGNKAK